MGPDDVRDVVRFNALGIALQGEPLLQVEEHLLSFFLLIVTLGKTLPRIFYRHLEQTRFIASTWTE